MTSLSVLLLLLRTVAYTYAAGPEYVPISSAVKFRGAALSIGTPPQNLSFQPVPYLHNAWIYNESGYCDITVSAKKCTTERGGLPVWKDSSTFHSAGNLFPASGSLVDNSTITEASWANDTLLVTSNVSLDGFPLGIIDQDLTGLPQNPLGLGRNSTLLTRLIQMRTISSRAWSFWWGLSGAEKSARMDGGLVLGGYDAAKIKNAKNHTGQITEPGDCPSGLVVAVTDILLKFPNGSMPSLLHSMPGSTNLEACLCPECSSLMTFPRSSYYLTRFQEMSYMTEIPQTIGTDGSNSTFMVYFYPEDVYQGDIIIGLESGLNVTIPNSQFVVAENMVSNDTGVVAYNSKIQYVMLGQNEYEHVEVLMLGKYFFTAAVMLVNHEIGEFTLWEANPTTDTDLVSIPASQDDSLCQPSPTGIINPILPMSTLNPSQQEPSSKFPIGAIIGVIIGGVALLAIIVIISFCYIRRNKAKALHTATVPPIPSYAQKPKWNPGVQELVGDHAPEFEGSEHFQSEIYTQSPKLSQAPMEFCVPSHNQQARIPFHTPRKSIASNATQLYLKYNVTPHNLHHIVSIFARNPISSQHSYRRSSGLVSEPLANLDYSTVRTLCLNLSIEESSGFTITSAI
ncbi:hypothetical protein EJ05DRAFT_483703 [Pseudovirgaria hyperparasitica]|uniref:Peptidase A1 domain-containing protein n=1 Tax=Pseudovirgaria hyperparasitica TaxID=470096 RepID=A0A6A6WES8_9PEZI|nr:uncharacterized protein EJ05DRAFT_483703 [Pseudovirgaria hyperparasitica]KAF2761322.1 hypothetical protein EJ05DRAFT_483703 [Pseudovirgaria hyperparasitica]